MITSFVNLADNRLKPSTTPISLELTFGTATSVNHYHPRVEFSAGINLLVSSVFTDCGEYSAATSVIEKVQRGEFT